MRLVFAGTPAVAVPSLRVLAAGPHEIVAVVTRGDAPLGRKRVFTPSPVAQAAEEVHEVCRWASWSGRFGEVRAKSVFTSWMAYSAGLV